MFTWCDRFKSHIDNDGMLRQDIESLYILVLLDREKKTEEIKTYLIKKNDFKIKKVFFKIQFLSHHQKALEMSPSSIIPHRCRDHVSNNALDPPK